MVILNWLKAKNTKKTLRKLTGAELLEYYPAAQHVCFPFLSRRGGQIFRCRLELAVQLPSRLFWPPNINTKPKDSSCEC